MREKLTSYYSKMSLSWSCGREEWVKTDATKNVVFYFFLISTMVGVCLSIIYPIPNRIDIVPENENKIHCHHYNLVSCTKKF